MWKRIAAALVAVTALVILAGADNYDSVNPKTVAKDQAQAHWDTTWTTGSSSDDTLTFGFGARRVSVCTPSGVTVQVQVLGAADLLKNPILGTANNPRAGLARVASTLYTLEASACRTFDNDQKVFYGVRLKATGTDGAVLIDVDN